MFGTSVVPSGHLCLPDWWSFWTYPIAPAHHLRDHSMISESSEESSKWWWCRVAHRTASSQDAAKSCQRDRVLMSTTHHVQLDSPAAPLRTSHSPNSMHNEATFDPPSTSSTRIYQQSLYANCASNLCLRAGKFSTGPPESLAVNDQSEIPLFFPVSYLSISLCFGRSMPWRGTRVLFGPNSKKSSASS